MSTSILPDSVHDAISGELADAEARLSRLEQRQRETVTEIAALRSIVDAYRAIMQYRQGQRLTLPTQAARLIPTEIPTNGTMPTKAGGGRTPGNRGVGMPARNERFAKMGVKQGFVALANEWGIDRQPEDFIRSFWVITSQADRNRARRTAMSDLAHLAGKGQLVKTGRGRGARYGPARNAAAGTANQEVTAN